MRKARNKGRSEGGIAKSTELALYVFKVLYKH